MRSRVRAGVKVVGEVGSTRHQTLDTFGACCNSFGVHMSSGISIVHQMDSEAGIVLVLVAVLPTTILLVLRPAISIVNNILQSQSLNGQRHLRPGAHDGHPRVRTEKRS
jgi:hypothetical protein